MHTFMQFPTRGAAPSSCLEVEDSLLSDPCPGPGAPTRCVLVDLMEFMSEYVFAFALSGSGPRKGSRLLRDPKRGPSWTFCTPAEVRDHPGKQKERQQVKRSFNVYRLQDSTSSKVFA